MPLNFPTLDSSQPSASAEYHSRYEDIAQDGRLRLEAVPQGVGPSAWRALLRDSPVLAAARAARISAIPSRFVIQVLGGPISVRGRLAATSRYELARSDDRDGEVRRLMLNFFTEISGIVATTHDPQPENRGEAVQVGRAFTEHVWTRPLAPRGQRRVLSLPTGHGVPAVPERRYDFRSPVSTLELPRGASWLEPAESADPHPLDFGLMHTDSNNHVNSLVYPRLFEEAALRRRSALGERNDVLGTHLDLAFARPCFAGETLSVVGRAFELDGRFGFCARITPQAEPAGKPRSFARLLF